METKITLTYGNTRDAEAIAKAVSPDNFKVPPSLYITTTNEENRVVTHIKCKKKMPTFIATVDDLLFCITTAEKTLQTAKKFG